MSQDLKARLRRYRAKEKTSLSKEAPLPSVEHNSFLSGNLDNKWAGWVEVGFKTLKRAITVELSFPFYHVFPPTMPILVPDFLRLGRIPAPADLFFFDLETTGLSGGAGTVAFLAAFGRFDFPANAKPEGNAQLVITQYLLLDYPGECDFITSVTSEINSTPSSSSPVMVSYNGKSFDSQILETRCLMNRFAPPEYFHADLLHPARRLWKKELSNCSQSTIEVSVLGLDRTGDVSGVMAPDIWFSFLRDNNNHDLLSICEHNVKDIIGLASIFLALAEISSDPIGSRGKFRFNEESLAIYWWRMLKKLPPLFQDNESQKNHAKTGEMLLEKAAENGSIPAAIIFAKYAEWQLADYALALRYTKLALANCMVEDNFRESLERRLSRLEKKIIGFEKR